MANGPFILRLHEPRWFADADWLGIPSIVLVVFTTSFWMLPRALFDSAIANPWTDAAKFLSLPLLAGLPLGLSWRRMPPLGRAFIWANFIPKLGAIGGLYLASADPAFAPTIGLTSRPPTGWTLVAIAVGLGDTRGSSPPLSAGRGTRKSVPRPRPAFF